MKVLIYTLFMGCFVQAVSAQGNVYIVPVGEDTYLDTILGAKTIPFVCQFCAGSCFFGWSSMSNVNRPFHSDQNYLSAVYIAPDSAGFYTDDIKGNYYNYQPTDTCCRLSGPGCGSQTITETFHFAAQAYYRNSTILAA